MRYIPLTNTAVHKLYICECGAVVHSTFRTSHDATHAQTLHIPTIPSLRACLRVAGRSVRTNQRSHPGRF